MSTERSGTALANEAFVKVNDWQVREIELALAEAKAGAPGVTHERVAAYLRSWGTDSELPPPEPEKGA